MEHLAFIKSIIDDLHEAQPEASKEKIILLLMDSVYSDHLKNLTVAEIAFLLDINKKQVIKILKSWLGEKEKTFTNADGTSIITKRKRSLFLQKYKEQCDNIYATYLQYQNLIKDPL